MKLFKKFLSAIVVCVCCVILITSAGCQTYANNDRCGGIVKGFKCLGEKEEHMTFPQEETWTVMELEITFSSHSNAFYPFTLVSQSDYDYYNCSTVEELFANEEFITTYTETMTLEVKDGKAVFAMNTAFKSNTSVYFYEGLNEYKNTVKIEDFTNYIGYFHYN